MHLNSELVFRKHAAPFFKSRMRILEIGPFGHPSAYQKIIGDPSIEWHTLNLENKTLAEMGNRDELTILTQDPYHYPIKEGTYDIVLSGNVMEHVEDIFAWYSELKRVVKKQGLIITVMPLSWPYHEAPVDCWRIYPTAFDTILKYTGLEKVLCLFESLEFEEVYRGYNSEFSTFIPGRSIFYMRTKKLVDSYLAWNKSIRNIPFLRRFAIPIEVAYDTICISKNK